MKAVVIRQHGGVDMLKLEDVPTPEPRHGEILVRIHAAAVNHFDHDIREGISRIQHAWPHIPGVEGAGEVVEIGDGVTRVSVGDRVIPYNPFCGTCRACLSGLENLCIGGIKLGVNTWGTYAEFIRVGQDHVVHIPRGLDMEVAAATPTCFGTAWQMSVTLGCIVAGEDVLVNAAGSGVGSSAIQIARLHGARVIATAGSDAKLAQALELGADAVINYDSQSLAEEVLSLTKGKGADLVIESVGGSVLTQSIEAVAVGGRLVTCGAHAGETIPLDVISLFRRQIRIQGNHYAPRREIAHVLRLVSDGLLTPIVNTTYPLAEVQAAARATADRSLFGKLVLLP